MISIGKVIKTEREKLGLTQVQLSYGICTSSTLSRIERDEQTPSRAVFKNLMERMGLSSEMYPSFLDQTDKAAYELQHDFNELYAQGKIDEAESKLNELDVLPGLDDVYTIFIRMCRVLIKEQRGADSNIILKEFEAVIELTIKKFKIKNIPKCYFTKTELNLLNAYALALYSSKKTDECKTILRELIYYIEQRVYDRAGISLMYTKLLYNLSIIEGCSGNDQEVLSLCNKGINDCRRYDRLTYMPNLLYNKGRGLINLNIEDEAHDCIRQSYYFHGAMGASNKKSAKRVKLFAEKNGIVLY